MYNLGLIGYSWKSFSYCLEVPSSMPRSRPWSILTSQQARSTHHHVMSALLPKYWIGQKVCSSFLQDVMEKIQTNFLANLISLFCHLPSLSYWHLTPCEGKAAPSICLLLPPFTPYSTVVNVSWILFAISLKPSNGFPLPIKWNPNTSAWAVSREWSGPDL